MRSDFRSGLDNSENSNDRTHWYRRRGCKGVQAHPQNFQFCENPQNHLNPGKICGNLCKMCEYIPKIPVCASILKKWHPKLKRRHFFHLGEGGA